MTTATERKQQRTTTESDPRWAAVMARDANTDGSFYYSVATTGVYCRPSCSARRALPENVRFHDTCGHAERAGFRACRRCRPDEPSPFEQQTARIASACRFIEMSEESPTLEQLAAHAGLSRYHFHRIFRSITGVTPKQYTTAFRQKRIREALAIGDTITGAIFDAGYNSNARFYDHSNKVLGMTPSRYRAGGALQEIRFAVGECSLGSILVAESDLGVCAILLGDDPELLTRDLQDRFPRAELLGADVGFEQRVAQVVGFVEAPSLGLSLPLDIRGTAFQQRVWQALSKIAAGTTASYTEIARRIGSPTSARAVAQACGANALAVAIPCHRVVRIDGALSGYRWGIERKRALLDREAEQD